MEEMLNKFIDEGKQEHEEMRAFIYDFQTNNELLFKERNNSLIELIFGVQELLKVINNVRVTTRGGKTTTQDVHDNDTNVLPKEPASVEPEKPVGSNEKIKKRERRGSTEEIPRKFEATLHQLAFYRSISSNAEVCQISERFANQQGQTIMNKRCSAVLLNKLPSKEKDPGSFNIPCDIGQLHIGNALADLEASISLMPYTMYEKLSLEEPKATRMSLELDDRPFLATARAMIDVFNKKITLRVGDDEVVFDVDQSIKRPTTEDDECYGIDDLDDAINEEAQELLANEEHDSFLSKGLEKSIDQSDLEYCETTSSDEKNGSDSKNSIRRINSVNTPYPVTQGTTNGSDVKCEHLYSASANEIDEKKPELKNLPQHLEYAYLHGDKSFPIIISSELFKKEKISFLQVLERQKGAIA
ncbi:hypothetical protein Tco_0985210 [Tanacetum coccineum]